MFAISFDLSISDLETFYGAPYNRAYYEVKNLLKADGFEWIQGSTYISNTNDLSYVFRAIMHLKNLDWFKKSVRDIRGFRVEDWSDFTQLIKEE